MPNRQELIDWPIYPTKCDTKCPQCTAYNTIRRPFEPNGKITGMWECDECGWTGLPKDFEHIPKGL